MGNQTLQELAKGLEDFTGEFFKQLGTGTVILEEALSNGKSEMERWFVRTEEVLGCVIEKRSLGMDFVEKLVDALTRADNKLNDTEMALEGKNAFQALFTANVQQEYQKAGLLYMAGNLGVKDEKLITQAQQDLTVALTKANFDLLKLFIPNSSELQSSLKSIFGDLAYTTLLRLLTSFQRKVKSQMLLGLGIVSNYYTQSKLKLLLTTYWQSARLISSHSNFV